MAQKLINIQDLGIVKIQKRKDAKNIRLSVSHDGVLRVTIPVWTPYKAGEMFALSKRNWIQKQLSLKHSHKFQSNQRIGKSHRIIFVSSEVNKISARVSNTEIIIRFPKSKTFSDEDIQKKLRVAAIRALKREAKLLLPQRLNLLADKYNFEFRSVNIKNLKSRWGSCSSNQDIALNCFLMQLPWELIDYVLLHELVHTKIMAHGSDFWKELSIYVSDLSDKRKIIKNYQPILISQD